MIGVLGAFGIMYRHSSIPVPLTVIDYFKKDALPPLIVEIIYLVHLVSVLPLFLTISKTRIYGLIEKDIPKSLDYALNIIIMIIFSVMKMNPKLSPVEIMNFNGTVCCFFIVYLLPILMHLNCYHGTIGFINKSKRIVMKVLSKKNSYSVEKTS